MKLNTNKLLQMMIAVLLSSTIYAQEKIFETDFMLSFKYLSENLLILNPNKGELVSVVSVGEPISNAILNHDKGVFYIITSSHIYKGNVSDGQITDQYLYYEADPQDNMAKVRYVPLGISHTGRAVLMHTGEMNMNTTPPKLTQELYVADINTKTRSLLYDISPKNITFEFFEISEKGEFKDVFILKDTKNNKRIYLDLKNNKVLKTVDNTMKSLKSKFPELKDYKERSTVSKTDDNIITYTYNKPKEQHRIVVYDTKTDEVILHKKYDPLGKIMYGFAGYNASANTYYIGKSINNFDQDQPDIEDYDLTKPDALESFMKASEEWRNNAFKPENYSVIIYDDKELTNEIARFENTRSVPIYKGKYAWINRGYEIELYNLETNQSVWNLDTDF